MTEFENRSGETKIILLDLEYGDSSDYLRLCTVPHSNNPVVVDGIQYITHLLSVSNISHSVEALEGGSQVATCTIAIQNVTGEYYSFRDTYKTKNRIAKIYIAFESDIAGTKQLVFDGRVQSDDIDDEEWSITLEDTFGKYDQTLPKNLYDTETYPNLEEGAAGIPIPYPFGKVEKAIATEINTSTHKFKVSDLTIKQFDYIYEVGVPAEDNSRTYVDVKSKTTLDAANGEFTLSLAAFDIQYIGAAATSILNISKSGWLNIVNAGNVDNLTIDTTDERYNTIKKIVDYIHAFDGGDKYTCTIDTADDVSCIRLKAIYDVDIETASTQVNLAAPEKGTIVVDFLGVKDDGAGLYTGTADALIERPCDIVHYIMRSICGMDGTEIDTTSFANARGGIWGGFEFRRYLTDLVSSFELISQISTESFAWCYVDNLTGKLTWENKKGDDNEAIDNYYYESGQFPRIEANTLNKQASIRDLWNKIDVNYGYIHDQGKFAKTAKFENTHSQSETTGYGTTNTYKKDCYWIPEDITIGSIQYTGTGTCKLTISGSDDDEQIRFQTEIVGGSGEPEHNLDLEGSAQDVLSELQQIIDSDILYSHYIFTLDDSKYNTLESIGLSDVTDLTINTEQNLTFSFAKLLGLKLKRRYSILMDTVQFNTSLFGFKQSLAKPIKVKSIKEGSDKRFRILAADGNPDDFDVAITAEYEPLCSCFNTCYGYSTCTCDQECYSHQACQSCDNTCYEETTGCTCDSTCYQYSACTCDNTCYEEGTSCDCDSTCYGYSSCSCNATCYGQNCSCDSTCYTESCTCNNKCYSEQGCYCDDACYQQGPPCTCDRTCHLQDYCTCQQTCYEETCYCDGACYGEGCTCNMTCYSYSGCSCNATCYGYVVCQCNNTCYLYQGCQSCDNTCYEEATGCTCDSLCYQYLCTCDSMCYSEEQPCSCDYTVY